VKLNKEYRKGVIGAATNEQRIEKKSIRNYYK
jgi:hypothetical protein